MAADVSFEVECLLCNVSFSNDKIFGHVANRHFSFNPYACPSCDFQAPYVDLVLKHAMERGCVVDAIDQCASKPYLKRLLHLVVNQCRAAALSNSSRIVDDLECWSNSYVSLIANFTPARRANSQAGATPSQRSMDSFSSLVNGDSLLAELPRAPSANCTGGSFQDIAAAVPLDATPQPQMINKTSDTCLFCTAYGSSVAFSNDDQKQQHIEAHVNVDHNLSISENPAAFYEQVSEMWQRCFPLIEVPEQQCAAAPPSQNNGVGSQPEAASPPRTSKRVKKKTSPSRGFRSLSPDSVTSASAKAPAAKKLGVATRGKHEQIVSSLSQKRKHSPEKPPVAAPLSAASTISLGYPKDYPPPHKRFSDTTSEGAKTATELLARIEKSMEIRESCCYNCDADFTKEPQLRLDHVWAKHAPWMPFRCGACDFVAESRKRVTSHYNKKHGPNAAANIQGPTLSQLQQLGVILGRCFPIKRIIAPANRATKQPSTDPPKRVVATSNANSATSSDSTKTAKNAKMACKTVDPLFCRLCKYRLSGTPVKSEHVWRRHMGTAKPFTCGICGRYANCRKGEVEAHARQMHPRMAVKIKTASGILVRQHDALFEKCFGHARGDGLSSAVQTNRAETPKTDNPDEKSSATLDTSKSTGKTESTKKPAASTKRSKKPSVSCSLCRRPFFHTNHSHYRSHVLGYHFKQKMFKCSACSYGANPNGYYRVTEHISSVHKPTGVRARVLDYSAALDDEVTAMFKQCFPKLPSAKAAAADRSQVSRDAKASSRASTPEPSTSTASNAGSKSKKLSIAGVSVGPASLKTAPVSKSAVTNGCMTEAVLEIKTEPAE